MIRDVVVHLPNEQPLLADLPAMPSSTDTVLICTNLRLLNGQTPIFVDRSDSLFIMPLDQVRFIEILRSSVGDRTIEMEAPPAKEAEPDLEIDEDFLRKIRDA